jgi:hypothetical protein
VWESRVAPLSGVVFAVLLVASALIINNYEFMPPQDEIAQFYLADSRRIMVGSYVGLLASFFLLWFAGSVRSALRRVEGESDRLSTVAFGGGVFAAAMITLGYLATTYGAERALLLEGIDPGGAAVLFDLASAAVGSGAPFGFAALIGGFALIGLRSGELPRWLAWSSLVMAVGLISPVNWLVVGLVVIWIPVVSVRQYRRNAAQLGPGAYVEEKVG